MKFVPRELGDTADASRGGLPLRAALRTGALILAVLVALYFAVGMLAEALAARVSTRTEASLFGELSFPGSRAPRAEDAGEARAQAVLARLLDGASLPALPYRLEVLDTKTPNAFALPGGAVGVTRGLLDLVEGEVGLAFVLAHELGHHAHRHAMRRLGRVLGAQILLSLAFGGELHPALGSLERLVSSAYSRAQELEADAFAIELVRQRLGTVEGALSFFERMLEREGEDGSPLSAFAASHPLTRDRLARLRAQTAAPR